MRRAFSHLAAERRAARKAQRPLSIAERLSTRAESSADGSPGTSTPNETELRRALDAALASLTSLSHLYEQREARWRDEIRRQDSDREKVDLLLRQVLGPVMMNGHSENHIGQ